MYAKNINKLKLNVIWFCFTFYKKNGMCCVNLLLSVNLNTHVISGLPLLAYLTISLQIYIGKTCAMICYFLIFVL